MCLQKSKSSLGNGVVEGNETNEDIIYIIFISKRCSGLGCVREWEMEIVKGRGRGGSGKTKKKNT